MEANVEKKPKKKRKVLKIVLIIVAILVGIVAAYFIYVFASYHRLDDNLPLEPETVNASENCRDPYKAILKDAIPTGKGLLAASYNIGFGAYSDDYTFFMDGGSESWARSEDAVRTNISGAVDYIKRILPDIVLFQEVDFDSTRSYHIDERQLIIPEMADCGSYSYTWAQNYDSPFLMYPFNQPHGASKSCIMTFANAGITEATRISLPIETGFSKFLDLDRCYSRQRIPTDNGKELVLYNFHLSAYTSDPQTAENQIKLLVADMQSEYDKGNYCIAGGDFNRDLLGNSPEIFGTEVLEDNWAAPINMELFTDDITLVVPFNESTMVASCRNPDKPYEKGDFVVTVDGFVKSANVELEASNVVDTGYKYSDHNPVYMSFVLE